MNLLASYKIELFCKNQNGSNALHIAVKKGNHKAIDALLALKFPLDEQKKNGITALGIACYKGNLLML
jgi:ankyrin repeat protein